MDFGLGPRRAGAHLAMTVRAWFPSAFLPSVGDVIPLFDFRGNASASVPMGAGDYRGMAAGELPVVCMRDT